MYEEYLSHVPKDISQEIEDYVTNVVFKNSRYIFTTRENNEEKGYCTHCKSEYKTAKFKHNSKHVCPVCGSICTVKQAWRGHKSLLDEACFIWYEKSILDPTILVARGFYTHRDYSSDYKNVCNKYSLEAVYIFDDKPKMLKYSYWDRRWNLTKSIYSFNINSLSKCEYFYSWVNVVGAIENTRYRYCPCDFFQYWDMLKLLDLYNKYPLVEQLIKVGLSQLVFDKLEGANTYNAINWRGKDIFKGLKINRKDLKEIKKTNVLVTPLFLKLFQESKKENLTPEQVKTIEKHIGRNYNEFLTILKYTSLRKISKYIDKTTSLPQFKHSHYSNIFSTWNDYLEDCKKLNFDITKESIFFPKNLYTAHQNTIKQVKYKADQELKMKIEQRLKSLTEKYYFEFNGLLVRPAKDSAELIAEGKALNHCVGGYARRYADGVTNIFVVRKVTEPDKPFYTLEFRDNSIIQVRGNHNCAPTKEVGEFIKAFREAKLEKKKSKIKIPA